MAVVNQNYIINRQLVPPRRTRDGASVGNSSHDASCHRGFHGTSSIAYISGPDAGGGSMEHCDISCKDVQQHYEAVMRRRFEGVSNL
jgi:hypothetical protein